MSWGNRRDVTELIGKTLLDCERMGEAIVFTVDDGKKYRLYHYQNCCECVSIEDICGDLTDLIGSPILLAEEISGDEVAPKGWEKDKYCDSYTWTFYKFATMKGYVTIRWYGESNGYYCESVDFEIMTQGE